MNILLFIIVVPAIIVFGLRFLRRRANQSRGVTKEITVDRALVEIVNGDIFVHPRRTKSIMLGGTIIILSIAVILGSIAGIFSPPPENAPRDFGTILVYIAAILIFAFLARLGYYLLKRALALQPIHFDAAARTITVGKDSPVAYSQVTSLYLRRAVTVTMGNMGGSDKIVEVVTGLIQSPSNLIPVASVSGSKNDKLVAKAMELLNLYGQQLGKTLKENKITPDEIVAVLEADQTIVIEFEAAKSVPEQKAPA